MDALPAGLVPDPAAVFDEHHRPDFPEVFRELAARSTGLSTALGRVRLSSVDLTAEPFARITRFRVLLSEVNALQLDAEAVAIEADPKRAPRVAVLRSLLESGRLAVRAAPLGGWAPDFSVFFQGREPRWLLTGHHWFDRSYPHRGPAIASLHGAEGARRAAARHAELWERSHDVGPAVWNILSRARRAAPMAVVSNG